MSRFKIKIDCSTHCFKSRNSYPNENDHEEARNREMKRILLGLLEQEPLKVGEVRSLFDSDNNVVGFIKLKE